MSVSASSSAAMRRSWIPVRSTIHSSVVSTYCLRSSLVMHAVGHVHAEPGDADACAVRRTDHRSTANVNVPRAASSIADVGRRLAAADRAADLVDLARQRERVAGLDDTLEAAVVDAGEEGDPAAILLLDEHCHGARLGHRLDDQHTGHHRAAGEVPGEPPVVRANVADRDDAASRLEYGHLVEQEKWLAVRQDRLDHVPAERRLGSHVAALGSQRPARPGGRLWRRDFTRRVYFARPERPAHVQRDRHVACVVTGVGSKRADLTDARHDQGRSAVRP